ncbi:unnamed protein product [Prorocentrum cordatum]|uniref:Uncharacterized protein n=1 Tax=Prorocentrum cordatum TaxID=2364126 RepID=A0ABN9UF82_9DINO|nr:unnamed protein product [Polarella glacialis]
MQVEIIDIFAKSLDHTPWFRFPFKDFLRIYFRVLLQEASVVEAKLGFMKAYFSSAFITDLIPGVVMAVLFGQLQWLAAPLVATQSGYEDQDKERLLEELVLHHPPAIDHSIFGEGGTALTPKGGMERQRCGKAFRPEISLGSRGTDTITAQAELNVQRQQRERTEGSQTAQGRGPIPFSSASDQRNSSLGQFWYSIHPSIAQVRRISPMLSVVATPPFKTMGDVLLNIAVRIPGATCLQISNQSEVQVRISVNTVVEDAARGCASGTEGRAPTSGGEAGGIAKEQQDRIAASIREKLERNRGVKVLSTYSYPLDGPHPKQAPPKLQMALGVQAPQLLCLIRDCIAQGICVEQIYDFWCG